MSNDVKAVVERIAGVAARAADARALVFGTVLSRNLDGSLNVDDGRGGCVRVAAAANIRVGQKIALGAEPAIGTTTNLAVRYIIIYPLGGCPPDPRDPPIIPKNAVAAAARNMISTRGFAAWSDRDNDQGTGLPSNCSTWFSYKGSAAVTSAGSATILAGYRKEVIGICPQTVLYTVDRSFFKFDLSAAGVSGFASAGRLKLCVATAGAVSPHGADIVVVPADVTFPIDVGQMNGFDRSTELGRAAILGGYTQGANTYGLTIDLDLSSFEGEIPDPFYLCLMTDFDLDGTTPSQVHALINNEDIQDFLTVHTTALNGPPILELDLFAL